MSKEYDYLVTLKKIDGRLFDYISHLMILIALLFFLYIGFRGNTSIAQIYWILSALLVASWAYVKLTARPFRIPFLVAILGWIYLPGWFKLIALLYIIAFFLERQVKLPVEIGVDEEGISFNHFPIKKYNWNELSNVVIKEGLITIDYKNNKLLQKELDSEITPELEREFNEFCTSKLAAQRS